MKEKITFEVTYGSDETDRCKGCIYLKCNYDDCMYGPFCKGHDKPILSIVRVKEEEEEEKGEDILKELVNEFTFEGEKMNYKKAYEMLKEFLLNLNAGCITCEDYEKCERGIDCFEYGPYWKINQKFIKEIEEKANEK